MSRIPLTEIDNAAGATMDLTSMAKRGSAAAAAGMNMANMAVNQVKVRMADAAQPPDPLEFLKNEIRTNPVVPGPYNIEETDERPIAEQEKRLDVRSLNTKKASLRRVFDRFANKEGLVKVAKLLVDCEENPTILLEACPKHARDLPLALEKVVTDGGLMDWAAFRDCGLLCLSQPGLSPGQEAD